MKEGGVVRMVGAEINEGVGEEEARCRRNQCRGEKGRGVGCGCKEGSSNSLPPLPNLHNRMKKWKNNEKHRKN